jgi:CRP-like cAMP-binding protein
MTSSISSSFNIEPFLESLGQARKTVAFRKRQIIFSVGDRSDSIYFIESGSAKLTVTSAKGKEALVAVLDGGRFFGENALDSDRRPRTTNAIALTNLRATRIEREAMLRLLHAEEDAFHGFVSSLIRTAEALKGELASNLLYASEQRLARALCSLSHTDEHSGYQRAPSLSQQELANMVGITRQRVNALMKRFKKLGFIDYAGGLRVHGSIWNVTGDS